MSLTRRSIWTRDRKNLPPFQEQARDLEISRLLFRYRFLKANHLHLLLTGSLSRPGFSYLQDRLRVLFQHTYIDRPICRRPTQALTDEIVYALGKCGATRLAETDGFEIGKLKWETMNARAGLTYLEHQLMINEFLIPFELALKDQGLLLNWSGVHETQEIRIRVSRRRKGQKEMRVRRPDTFFWVEDTESEAATFPFFGEFWTGSKGRKTPLERLEDYLLYWQSGASAKDGVEHFRVLNIFPTERQRDGFIEGVLSHENGRGPPLAWEGFWFTWTGAYSLAEPDSILEDIFLDAEGNAHSLLE